MLSKQTASEMLLPCCRHKLQGLSPRMVQHKEDPTQQTVTCL